MISDNYVTGDNIFLRELQSFFFDVLGMMSITHYGAIGDGRTDNYGPLQVAIDDAHRRGLSYIYVPYGRFIYTGELINTDGVTFIGNPHSHIVNVRTGEETEILQFGVQEKLAPRNIVTAYLDENYTMTSTLDLLHLSEYTTVGNALSLTEDGFVIVGEGVSYVKIDAQISFISMTDGTKDLVVSVGNRARVLNSRTMNNIGNDHIIWCASIVVPVSKGDKIRLQAGGIVGDIVYGSINHQALTTYMTVEAVG